MSFGQWYVSRGRIPRRTFWLTYVLPLLAVQVLAGIADVALGFASTEPPSGDGFVFSTTAGPIGLAVGLLTVVPSISSTVTRLHDRGHSAWWLLWLLLPIIGWLLLIVQTWFLPGDSAPNRYGPPRPAAQLAEPGYPQPYS
jgi:uncharacterized membrane protein YhaH (DUF805 family)